MSQDFSLAFVLLGVGMITVFMILALVVLLGNGLIRFVNTYYPEEVTDKVAKVARTASNVVSDTSGLGKNKMAAIVAAVDIATKGKGKVTGIQKR